MKCFFWLLLWVTALTGSDATRVSDNDTSPFAMTTYSEECRHWQAWPGNLGYYTTTLRVGSGAYDRVVVHRLVKDKSPGKPARTPQAVFLVHGDASGFASFLKSSEQSSLAAHLALGGIDVWGIDLRWNGVPAEVTDHSFMGNWNTRTHLTDINLTLKFARLTRSLTGSGAGRMNLLGFSTGGYLALALANEEAKLPLVLRDIKGLIAMDVIYKAAPDAEEIRTAAAGRHAILMAQRQAGLFSSSYGQNIQALGSLALAQSDEPSPVIPGLSNRQAALFVSIATWMTSVPPAGPYSPFFHYAAGVFSSENLPEGLQFIDEPQLLQYAQTVPPYQSLGEMIDQEALLAGIGESPYDNHLGRIEIPVLYVGAAGGAGDYGLHTLSLLGSRDKQALVIRLLPAEYEAVDFGHFDLLMANLAPELVWAPVLNWLSTH